MPTIIGPPRQLTERQPYPFILPHDWHIMDKFLDLYAHNYIEAYYNVRVGGPDPGKTHTDEKYDQLWQFLKSYKVDVILKAKDHILIAEVTTSAGPRAIGQALLYYHLYMKQPVLGENAKPGIITSFADDDIKYLAQKLNISLIII